MITVVPPAIRRYLEASLPTGPLPRSIRIAQEGQMWKKAGARALRFTATQLFAVERVAFSWHARFPIVGPLALDVIDEYADGDGRLIACLFGIPLQRDDGREAAIGEAIRYLAEVPLVPFAMEHNPELEWRELDDHAVEVATVVRGERLTARLDFERCGTRIR